MIGYIEKFLNALEIKKHDSLLKGRLSFVKGFELKTNEELKQIIIAEREKKQVGNYEKTSPEIIQAIAELSKRFLGLDPYDSQIRAALVLSNGQIAELGTGEGKTLSIVIATILNYSKSRKTHIVTANSYLVQRDQEFSAELFEFLGLKTIALTPELPFELRKTIYDYDAIYSTSAQLAFDYLNNNRIKIKDLEFKEVRDCIIIDEIDFVLIDEARTPIVLSSSADVSVETYTLFQEIQKDFKGEKKNPENQGTTEYENAHFLYKDDSLELTDKGFKLLEEKLVEKRLVSSVSEIYEDSGFSYIGFLEKALRANHLLEQDVNYILMNGQITPINQQTGRPQIGSRFSGGVHQALEAKLGVEIKPDSQTIGQTTLQNYFGKYKNLSGTTGTAATESAEFKEFYGLRVLPVQPSKPSQRKDLDDLLFLDKKSRNAAIVKKTRENLTTGRPTLIGTQTLDESEALAALFEKEGISFNLLNAKNHEKEAEIVANAGRLGSVTIATNMAGRGTDIMLGGNKEALLENVSPEEKESSLAKWQKAHDEVVEVGGLSVIGVARALSRRLDNQLIGRAGRQGDPGETQFYLSLEDVLFQNMPVSHLRSNWEKNDVSAGLSFPMLTKLVRESQKNYEGMTFASRKNLFKFDAINAQQREIFYEWRKKILSRNKFEDIIEKYFRSVLNDIISINRNAEDFLANDFEEMEKDYERLLGQKIDIRDLCKTHKLEDDEDFVDFVVNALVENYNEKMTAFEAEDKSAIEKDLLLSAMDENYAETISSLEGMRGSTSLRAYAQKNPFDEYQKEALEMFGNLVKDVKSDFCKLLIKTSPFSYMRNNEKSEAEKTDSVENKKTFDMTPKRYKRQPSPNGVPYKLGGYLESVGV